MADGSEIFPGDELKDEELETVVGSGQRGTKNTNDPFGDMATEDIFYLQNLMEQKSQLEQMVSNTMKAGNDTRNNLTSNLKA